MSVVIVFMVSVAVVLGVVDRLVPNRVVRDPRFTPERAAQVRAAAGRGECTCPGRQPSAAACPFCGATAEGGLPSIGAEWLPDGRRVQGRPEVARVATRSALEAADVRWPR